MKDKFFELFKDISDNEYRIIGINTIMTIAEASMLPSIVFKNTDGTEDRFDNFDDAYDVAFRRMRILPKYRKEKLKKILK